MGEPTKEQVEAAIAEHCAFGVEGAAAAVMRLLDRPAPLAPAEASYCSRCGSARCCPTCGSSGTAPAQEPTGAMIALDDLRGALEVGSLPNTAWGRTFIESRCRIVVAALRSSAAPPPQDTADSERYKWLTNRVLACDYGDNDAPGEQIGWRIRHDLLRGPDGKRQPAFMFGESIDKAIDAARGHPDTTGDTNG